MLLKSTQQPVITLLFILFSAILFIPSTAFAGDGARIVLKDGREAVIRDGYKNLMDAMRKRKKDPKEKSHVVEINLDGNSFFIDANEIAILCREPCRAFQMVKQK